VDPSSLNTRPFFKQNYFCPTILAPYAHGHNRQCHGDLGCASLLSGLYKLYECCREVYGIGYRRPVEAVLLTEKPVVFLLVNCKIRQLLFVSCERTRLRGLWGIFVGSRLSRATLSIQPVNLSDWSSGAGEIRLASSDHGGPLLLLATSADDIGSRERKIAAGSAPLFGRSYRPQPINQSALSHLKYRIIDCLTVSSLPARVSFTSDLFS